MTTLRKRLLVDGNDLTAAFELMQDGHQADKPADWVLGGPYEVVFDDNHRFLITAVNTNPPSIETSLYTPNGGMADSRNHDMKELVGEYTLLDGSDVYIASIQRAASPEMSREEIQEYRSNNGARCPHCGDHELHKQKAVDTAERLERSVQCCCCGAKWTEQFSLTNVVPVSPPTQNVPRQ